MKDITHGAALQGGSTITMQLVRNLYLGGDQHTLRQKIVEAKLAIDYANTTASTRSSPAISTAFPTAPSAGRPRSACRRPRASSSTSPASQLNLEQAALLAGLPQAPSQYNPFLDSSAARLRRNEVLTKMAELHYISGAQAAAAKAAPLEVKRGHYYSQRSEPFFFEYVREQLVHRYGKKTVEQGGLKVYTTINLNMQRLARKAIAEVLNEPEDPASAIVTINPHNGEIDAMAESENYEQSQYNLAADGHRQPGSTFKAIDLADALSRGIDPNSTYYVSHTLPAGVADRLPHLRSQDVRGDLAEQVDQPRTGDARLGQHRLRPARRRPRRGNDHADGLQDGCQNPSLRSYPAEALGGLTLGVTPLEMADVYATLADGGWRNKPIAITKVVFPDGHVDSQLGPAPPREGALEGVTAEETSILHQNVLGGTATRSAIGCPTAAKTGTTSELVDAWLDGYTPELLDRRVDGLPEQARVDDRRPRRAPTGRLSAGGNLARVHDRGHRRPEMHRIPRCRTEHRSPTSRSSASSRPPDSHPRRAKTANEENRARKKRAQQAKQTPRPHAAPGGGERHGRTAAGGRNPNTGVGASHATARPRRMDRRARRRGTAPASPAAAGPVRPAARG